MTSMFTPRYPQPFTLEQAFALDVPIISEGSDARVPFCSACFAYMDASEISRLENSLEHLRETQALLQEHIVATGGDTDDDINNALKENEGVIGSQEERIDMLKMALRNKGITSTSHYQSSQDVSERTESTDEIPASHSDDGGEGIHL